jgi:hypothetical protein
MTTEALSDIYQLKARVNKNVTKIPYTRYNRLSNRLANRVAQPVGQPIVGIQHV